MKKIYLVKKDPKAANSPENWNVLNGYEFARFMETENGYSRRRNFVTLPPCVEDDISVIIECDSWADAKTTKNENERLKYRRTRNANTGYITESYDHLPVGDTHVCGDDFLTDESVNIEEEVLHMLELDALLTAIEQLSEEDKLLIKEMYLDKNLSEKAFGDLYAISQQTVHNRKLRALRRLRKIMNELRY